MKGIAIIILAAAATCVSVYDGDSITVEFADGTVEKIRLLGIDTPEMKNNVHGRPGLRYVRY